MKRHWEEMVDFHLKQLTSDATFFIAYRKKEDPPLFMQTSLHKYISKDLPLTCLNARIFCPDKVLELEARIEEVKEIVYPLRVI